MWIRYTLINLDLLTSQDLYSVPTLWLLIHNGPNQLPKLSTNEATSMRKFTFLRFCCHRFFFPWKIHENKASRTNLEFFWSISLILRGLLIMILRTSFKTHSKISPKKFYSTWKIYIYIYIYKTVQDYLGQETMPRIHESIIVFK